MAIESVKARISALPDQMTAKELRPVLAAIVDAIQNIATKLDADTGTASTDYVATTAAIVTD